MNRRVLGAIEVSRVSVIFYDVLYAGSSVCVCVCVYLYVCLMAGNVMTVCEYVPYSTTHSSCQRVGLTKAQLSSISPQADKNRNLQLMWIFKL